MKQTAEDWSNSVHLEKTSKKKLMEQQQGYQQAFAMVETCVHAVRNEGEIFLSNLEGERRAHEAEVVSTPGRAMMLQKQLFVPMTLPMFKEFCNPSNTNKKTSSGTKTSIVVPLNRIKL